MADTANKRTQTPGRDAKGRFVKGRPGGPGRPRKEHCISAQLFLLMEQEAPGGKGRTYAEMIALAIVQQAMKGNPGYLKELMERLEGKVQPAKEGAKDEELSKLDLILASLDTKYGTQSKTTTGVEPGAGALELTRGRSAEREDV